MFEDDPTFPALRAELFDAPTQERLAVESPSAHPKVVELRGLAQWAEGMVWCSPERHGAMTGSADTRREAPDSRNAL